MTVNVFPWLYDALMAGAERGRLSTWRRATVAPARGRVIEIGAGTGLNFPYYPADVSVVATDADVRMLLRARERAHGVAASVHFVAADAERLPFREGAFDTGVVGLAMCTIPYPDVAVAELRRVVRSGGGVNLLEHVRMKNPVGAKLQDWLTPAWRLIAGGCHLNRDTVGTVRNAGLRIERVTPHASGVLVEILARVP